MLFLSQTANECATIATAIFRVWFEGKVFCGNIFAGYPALATAPNPILEPNPKRENLAFLNRWILKRRLAPYSKTVKEIDRAEVLQ